VKGKATDTLGQPIIYATISIKSISSLEIITYVFTDEDGSYLIKLPTTGDSLIIEFSHLEFGKFFRRIANKTQIIDFTIAPSEKLLSEVIVKSPPIYENGDTINF
jgi:hypothetical protein